MKVADWEFDPATAESRLEFALARAEFAITTSNRAAAELHAAIAECLDVARTHPELYLAEQFRALTVRDRIEFAERAAVADLAVRLGLSETSVRDRALDAVTLQQRLPRVWAEFLDARINPVNARCAAELARSLPDDPVVLGEFDAGIVESAAALTPVRFRLRACALRDRVHKVALAERHRAAAETRGVWIENDADAMAWLTMRLPADVAHGAFAKIDGAARDLARSADETRTIDQLRADVAGDLMLMSAADGRPNFTVAVTVPVMTLLGLSEEPATLDGYGPIDAETARRIAAHAPSFTRLLTHPISGGLLDIDRTSYRPPADLKRWLAVTDVLCTFPGCGRLARNSDIDHTVDRQFGGATRADNLAHLCRHHHRLKHLTGWSVEQATDRTITWTPPTGHRRLADQPPF